VSLHFQKFSRYMNCIELGLWATLIGGELCYSMSFNGFKGFSMSKVKLMAVLLLLIGITYTYGSYWRNDTKYWKEIDLSRPMYINAIAMIQQAFEGHDYIVTILGSRSVSSLHDPCLSMWLGR